ncbi:unnamed protein product [Meganyctiphanes norvegica]|uniref:Uncharacterized protein n=1 Tax=Meganyctiphanes norvegica TaxID=48144 RepID=A0AAV2PKX2_MEGNR
MHGYTRMAAPYPTDPSKASAPPNVGWGGPAAGYPAQPAAGYPSQPMGGYPAQPMGGYPAQPMGGYPAQPMGYAAQPPPYSAQPQYPGPGGYVLPGQAIGHQQYWGQPNVQYMVPPPPQPYNASNGGLIQSGQPPQTDPFPKDTEMPGQFGASFGDKAIRHAFIRKVYLILMCQLLITLGFVSLFTFHEGISLWVRRNQWAYWTSYAAFIVTYMTLVCCKSVRRKWPGNFIMLGAFTLALSYMTGTIASFYDTKIVVMTVGITAAICFLLTLFASQTKYDFTGCGVYLFVILMILFIFGIIAIFTRSEIMFTIYSAGIALVFSMYLVFDTQMIVGGRKHEISPEEHIFGAIMLYLDVINIFLALLSLFGGRD